MIPESLIKRTPTEKGESIEEMLRRCTANNEPIEASAPMIYTEEADGVLPQYDIRADRFDIALDAIDKVQKSAIAQSGAPVEGQEQQKTGEQNAPTANENNG